MIVLKPSLIYELCVLHAFLYKEPLWCLGLRLKFLIFFKEFEPHSSLIVFLFLSCLLFYQKFLVFTQLLQFAT